MVGGDRVWSEVFKGGHVIDPKNINESMDIANNGDSYCGSYILEDSKAIF